MSDEQADEITDLRADYVRLGKLLEGCSADQGSAASALSRERRMIRARLDELEGKGEGTVIDEVAARRESKTAVVRPPARRRQPR